MAAQLVKDLKTPVDRGGRAATNDGFMFSSHLKRCIRNGEQQNTPAAVGGEEEVGKKIIFMLILRKKTLRPC